jgi:hypothetical protein
VNQSDPDQTSIATPSRPRITHFYFLIPAVAGFALQRLAFAFPVTTETLWTTAVFRWLSNPVAAVTSRVPISLTEVLFFVGIPLILLWLMYTIWHVAAANTGRRLGLALVTLKKAGWVLSVGYLLFMMLHGINYARAPLAQTLQIESKERPVEDLIALADMLVIELNAARFQVGQDSAGVMRLRGGKAWALHTGHTGFQKISTIEPVFAIPHRPAKGVIASRWWSYTGISGMYFPFLVEANVNTDMPDSGIPATIMHELAHTIGFAREDEAEFAGILAGIFHDDPDFVYSAWLSAWVYTSSALARVDREAWAELNTRLHPAVVRDLQARRAYWQQFEGPVREASTRVNDAYLRSNLQRDGVQSYGRVVDLLLAWFMVGFQ